MCIFLLVVCSYIVIYIYITIHLYHIFVYCLEHRGRFTLYVSFERLSLKSIFESDHMTFHPPKTKHGSNDRVACAGRLSLFFNRTSPNLFKRGTHNSITTEFLASRQVQIHRPTGTNV